MVRDYPVVWCLRILHTGEEEVDLVSLPYIRVRFIGAAHAGRKCLDCSKTWVYVCRIVYAFNRISRHELGDRQRYAICEHSDLSHRQNVHRLPATRPSSKRNVLPSNHKPNLSAKQMERLAELGWSLKARFLLSITRCILV